MVVRYQEMAKHGLPSIATDLASGGLGLQLWTGSFCAFTGDRWTNHPHIHDDYQELCLVLEGSGSFRHDEEAWDLAPGSVFINEPGVVHEIASPQSKDLLLVFVMLRIRGQLEQRTDAAAQVLGAFLQAHDQHAAGQGHLLAMLPALCAPGTTALAGWRRQQLLQCFALEALAALCAEVAPSTPSKPMHHEQLAQAMRVIRQHLAAPVSVDNIAGELGISARHLRRLFRQHDGRSVVQAITDERLQQARRLLLQGFAVASSGQAVGFSSAAHFCRVFKTHFNESPGTYQRRHLHMVGTKPTRFL